MQALLSFTTREHLFAEIGLFLLGAVLLFVFYRYGRFFAKRILLALKLKKACKACNATLRGTSSFWMFGGRNTAPCDCYIETEKSIYALKLFGIAGRRSVLIFGNDRTYSIQNRWLPNINRHPLPKYRFRHKFQWEWELKTPRRILLLHPVCTAVRREENNKKTTHVNPHEQVFGMEVHTLSTLIQQIGEG